MSAQTPDADFNLTDPIFAWAVRAPSAVALIEQDSVISYGMLCLAVRHAMLRFREAGWREGDVIGVSMRGNFALHLVVVLALARMGLTQVTLSPGDPATRRLSVVQTLGISAVVTNLDGDRLDELPFFLLNNDWLSATFAAPSPPDTRSAGGDRIWIINQSSGTTGKPKSIALSHERFRIWSGRLQPVFNFLPGERFINLVGLRFWVGIWRAVCCLSDGGAIVALPESFSRELLLHLVDLHHITYLQCTPFHLHWLMQEVRGDTPRLPAMRILRCGSAGLIPSMLQDTRTRLSPNFFFTYGANEAGTLTAATPAILDRHPDSVGSPLPGVELEIVDEAGRRVPAGTVGQLRARCSRGKPSIKESSHPDDWIYPGDLAAQNDEGIVFIKGRYDEAINFDGILISPMEIESVLARHPSVAEVVAFALPSPRHQDVPAAALVLKQPLTQDELNRYCAEHLGILAPRAFLLVDAMPRNDRGKVLRRRLTEIALARINANTMPE